MSIPRAKYNGTEREVQERARARAAWMAERHPGVRFSLHVSNPLGVKEAKAMGMPGADYPSAIWDRHAPLVNDEETIQWVYAAWELWRDPMTKYVRFTTIHFATGLPFMTIFGVVNQLRADNPASVYFSVNRMGDCTVFRLGA